MSQCVVLTGNKVPIKAWIGDVQLEPEALAQLNNTANMRIIHKHIAVMPDVHWGMGATIGSVIPTLKAVIPAAVGVDIGCGMMAVQTGLMASDLPDNLKALRLAIEEAVPTGFGKDASHFRGGWCPEGGTRIPKSVVHAWASSPMRGDSLSLGYKFIIDRHPKLKKGNSVNHLGSLPRL